METEIQFTGDPADIALAAAEMAKILGRGGLAEPGAGFFAFRIPPDSPALLEAIREAINSLTAGRSLAAVVSQAIPGTQTDGPIRFSRG